MMRVIGHRGAAAVLPENTLPSFAAAIEAGVDAIELDVRLTSDGVAVAMHDDDVARTTGQHSRISEMTFAAVRALNAAASRAGRAEPLRVPTLEEVLALVDGRVGVVVELKATWDERGFAPAEPVARAVAPMVRGLSDVVVSSFDPSGVAAMREIDPSVTTALSVLRGFPVEPAIEQARAAGHAQLHPAEDAVTPALVARAAEAGLAVQCWTVNDEQRAAALRDMGVAGIFTDDPARLIAALRG